ncbi:MAG: hypothetical protein K8R69_00980 [Deltaproteobacteria bacterium]|nr:hypothetical protein [Deltaproteobacteria bacterium]
MSLTVVQRFYEVAKQEAEATALGVAYDGEFHELPWWFVKSKAKHFGLGLLEQGALEGEYFYLLSSPHPFWSYAELGALTVGLKTIPLPLELPIAALEALFKRFPPSFFFLGDLTWSPVEPLLRRVKGLRRVVLVQDDPALTEVTQGQALSFRKIFNAGIRSEAKHHAAYRHLRASLTEDREMSPLRIGPRGEIEERPLRYGDVNEVCARLSHALGTGKSRRLLSAADLSHTFARIVALYWPIFTAMQSVFAEKGGDPLLEIQKFRPEAILLPNDWITAMRPLLSSLSPPSSATDLPGKLRWGVQRRRLRAKLGKNLRCLFSETPLPGEFEETLKLLGIRSLAAQPSAPNFLL